MAASASLICASVQVRNIVAGPDLGEWKVSRWHKLPYFWYPF